MTRSDEARSEVLGRRLRAMATVRGAVTVAVTIFLLTAGHDLVTEGQAALVVPSVLVLLAFSLAVPFWPPTTHRAVLDVSLVVDAGGVAVLLAVTGGLASPFTSLVVLVVALDLLAFGVRTGLRAAVVTSLGIGWVWATWRDTAEPASDTGAVDDTRVLVLLLATWVAVGAVALLSQVVERDLRRAVRDRDRVRAVARATRPEDGPESVAQQLAQGLVRHLQVPSASVWWPYGDEIRMVPIAYHGRAQVLPLGTGDRSVRRTAPLVRQAMDDGEVVLGEPSGAVADLHSGPVAMIRMVGRRRAEDGLLVVGLSTARFGAHREVLSGALAEVARDAADALDEARHLLDLRELARTDPVTGLFNHRAMQERLREELSRVERQWERGNVAGVSVALLDLDHFKQVNDRHGHPTGDAVLAAVGEALDRAARTGDVVCRYGGEEFAIILADTYDDDARLACERFRRVLQGVGVPAPDGSTVTVTASFGVASAGGPGGDPARLLEMADTAMYRAKQGGRDQVVSGGTVNALASSP